MPNVQISTQSAILEMQRLARAESDPWIRSVYLAGVSALAEKRFSEMIREQRRAIPAVCTIPNAFPKERSRERIHA